MTRRPSSNSAHPARRCTVTDVRNASVDWAYIDGERSCDVALTELCNGATPVRPANLMIDDGFIVASELCNSVARALNDFVEKRNLTAQFTIRSTPEACSTLSAPRCKARLQ